MYLSKKHIRLLKKVNKRPIVRTDKYHLKDAEYLRSNDLVTARMIDRDDDFYYEMIITEKGTAVLHERLHASRRANVALALSIIAIVLSILTAFTPFPEWSQQIIRNLF